MKGKVVVTGAAGFIGSHLCERLLDEGFDVVGVDSFTDYYSPQRKRRHVAPLGARDGFRLVEENLAAADLGPLLEGADGVFHFAAQAGVRASWGKDFAPYLESNVLATQRVLEAVRRRPELRFVHASSSSVYGETAELPMREEHPLVPMSPYGATKLAAEHLVELYRRGFGLTCRTLRFFTVYGPRQRPDMAFSRFIEAGLGGDPIEVYGDGAQTRDFTHVSDAVEAAYRAFGYEGSETVFNIGGGSRAPLTDVIGIIEEELGTRFAVRRCERAMGDVSDTWADTSRAGRELGFAPAVGLVEGIRGEIAWYREYLSGSEGRTSSP